MPAERLMTLRLLHPFSVQPAPRFLHGARRGGAIATALSSREVQHCLRISRFAALRKSFKGLARIFRKTTPVE